MVQTNTLNILNGTKSIYLFKKTLDEGGISLNSIFIFGTKFGCSRSPKTQA